MSSVRDTIVAIPVFQGASTIAEVVRGAAAHGLPVVVVDDGSTDGSGDAAAAAGATVLRHPANQGKGAALRTAFAYAEQQGAEAVITLDADGQHDPAEIGRLLAGRRASPQALVVGVRSFQDGVMPRRSQTGNRISTFWISLYSGRRHGDTQSGFRIYPRRLFGARLRSSRFATETELLLVAAKLKVPLVEVPIRTIYPEGGAPTHFRDFRDTVRIVTLVISSPFWRVTERN